jgi:hypothetical protein
MALEDLKERLQSESKLLWEKVQDSALFIKTKDRYENLTPPVQKAVMAGVSLLIVYLFLSIPLGYFSTSSESVTDFESKRDLIRSLVKTSREAQEVPNIAVPPDVNSLKSQIDGQIQAARLLPEQIQATQVVSEKVNLIPGNLIQGVLRVSLLQLNLRQIVDLGYQFQAISPSVKMTDLKMEANAKDSRYYDVTYNLAVLNVPSEAPPVIEEPAPPKKKGK